MFQNISVIKIRYVFYFSVDDGVFGPVAIPVSNKQNKFAEFKRKRKRLRERVNKQ